MGPYEIRIEGHDNPLILKPSNMTDPTTRWFKIVKYNNKQAATIANMVKKTWLCRYLCPTIIMYDSGNECLCHALKNDLIKQWYGIEAKCANTPNPQTKSILERIHQVVANLVHVFDLQNNHLDKDEPRSDILAATDFAVRTMYHNTLQDTPGQMVFGRAIIINTPLISDCGDIRLIKQKIIGNNNQLENKNYKPHTYRIWRNYWCITNN